MRSLGLLPRFFITALLFILVLTPVSVVYADSPDVFFEEYEYDMPMANQYCPGIEVWYHEAATNRYTFYEDDAGNLKTVKIRNTGTDTFYNLAKPDIRLSGEFTVNLVYDASKDTFTGSGIPLSITVPGYGTVLMWTGFWTDFPSMHRGGQNSFENPKDMEAFCALLAGD